MFPLAMAVSLLLMPSQGPAVTFVSAFLILRFGHPYRIGLYSFILIVRFLPLISRVLPLKWLELI